MEDKKPCLPILTKLVCFMIHHGSSLEVCCLVKQRGQASIGLPDLVAVDTCCLQGRPRQYLLAACLVTWVPGVDICSLIGQDPEALNLQSFQLGLCV